MRKLLFLLLFTGISVYAQNDVVKFSATIANRNSDTIVISNKNFKKAIAVGKDGKFTASFPVATGLYEFYDGAEYTELYLKNGYDLQMTTDAKMFDETLTYKGKGEKENNFLARKMLDEESLESRMVANRADQDASMKIMQEYVKGYNERLEDPSLDPGLKEAFDVRAAEMAELNKKQMEMMMNAKKELEKLNGTMAPDFEYENYAGGTSKLSSLRGKYVYIDIWATWCGPCRAEIPYLKKVEHDFEGKNIEFVSVSIDKKKDYDKWKTMVKEQSLGGMQLFADKDWNSDFIRAFAINSIPRFLLIGPDGKVIDADTERPSMPELKARLAGLVK